MPLLKSSLLFEILSRSLLNDDHFLMLAQHVTLNPDSAQIRHVKYTPAASAPLRCTSTWTVHSQNLPPLRGLPLYGLLSLMFN